MVCPRGGPPWGKLYIAFCIIFVLILYLSCTFVVYFYLYCILPHVSVGRFPETSNRMCFLFFRIFSDRLSQNKKITAVGGAFVCAPTAVCFWFWFHSRWASAPADSHKIKKSPQWERFCLRTHRGDFCYFDFILAGRPYRRTPPFFPHGNP